MDDDFYSDDYMPPMMGIATTLPGRSPRRKKEPIGFCIDPKAYKPRKPPPQKQPKRRRK